MYLYAQIKTIIGRCYVPKGFGSLLGTVLIAIESEIEPIILK